MTYGLLLNPYMNRCSTRIWFLAQPVKPSTLDLARSDEMRKTVQPDLDQELVEINAKYPPHPYLGIQPRV